MKIEPGPLTPAVLQPPFSKSDALRALVLSHVLDAPGLLGAWAEEPCASDVRAAREGLSALREAHDKVIDIDCLDGAAPFRFLLAQAALTEGTRVRFWGVERLGQRPHAALIDALRAALGPRGLRIEVGQPWPVQVTAPEKIPVVDSFHVAGRESSQYVSALLMAAAAQVKARGQSCEVRWQGELASEGYLALTIDWLEQTGFTVRSLANGARLESWAASQRFPQVPLDASGLGYLLLLAWPSGSEVVTKPSPSQHPDLAMRGFLSQVGLTVEDTALGRVRVHGAARNGFTADAAKAPDLMPTLAALACVLPAPSTLENVAILRKKESDRLEGIIDLVQKASGRVELNGETLRITPGVGCAPLEVDSRGDHRLAMSAACLSVLAGVPARISQPACVQKSFPGFWNALASIGWRLE